MNRLGGIVCLACSPPKDPGIDDRGRLTIECGVWIDPTDRFDLVDLSPEEITKRYQPVSQQAGQAVTSTRPETAARPAASQGAKVTNNTFGNTPLSCNRLSRSPDGGLSEFESELFVSDEVWNSHETWIVYRGQTGLNEKAKREDEKEKTKEVLEDAWRGGEQEPVRRSMCCTVKTANEPGDSDRSPAWKTKETIRLTQRIVTFRGPLAPGEYRIAGGGQDEFGNHFVNLADRQTGEIVISGLFLRPDEFDH